MQLTKWVHESRWISKIKVIHWPWSKVTQIQHFHFLFLETAWPIEAKFYVEPPWDGRMKIWSNGLYHMTKLAAMPIYGKNLKEIISSGTKRPMTMKIGMLHWVLEYYQVRSNDIPGMTLTCFMPRSNLVPYAFVWEKGKTMDFSQKQL